MLARQHTGLTVQERLQAEGLADDAGVGVASGTKRFMNKIERLEITDASNKKEVCMALMDGYIEPIHLMLKKDITIP